MATQEYQIGITAFSSKEEYDKYVEISNYIDNNPQKWFQDKFHSKA